MSSHATPFLRKAHQSERRLDTYQPWVWGVLVAVLAFGAGRWSVGWEVVWGGAEGSSAGSCIQAASASPVSASSRSGERGWLQNGNPFSAAPAPEPKNQLASSQTTALASQADNAQTAAKEQTLQSLASLLQTGRLADIDQEKWAKEASQSAAALEFFKTQFMKAADSSQKQALFAILSGVDTPQRDSFAVQLTRSADPQDRVMAYQWLASSRHGDPIAVQQAILLASQQEGDSRALIAAINSLGQHAGDLDAAGKARSIARMTELTQHPDPAVARQAIGNLVSLSQDENTVSLLRAHLQAASPELQLAALRGLGRINQLDGDTRSQLTRLSADPSAASTVRKVSSDLLRDQSCSS